MCIYYKDRPSLHYNGQEHIYPASVGGLQKLPIGYVSDEFNNDISKLEQDFMRESIIASAREIEGPGKRGRLGEQYATKSKVHILSDSINDQVTGLGYIKLGEAIEIPNVLLNIETGQMSFSFSNASGTDYQQTIKQFNDFCQASEQLKVKNIIDDRLSPTIIILGIEQHVEENFNAFFARNTTNTLELSPEKIRLIGKSLLQFNKNFEYRNYLPVSKRKVKFHIDHLRIYGKIAFNFLAFTNGPDFVKAELFDPVRNWIAYGGNNSFAQLDNGPGLFHGLESDHFPSIHYVIITKAQTRLIASLALYGGLKAQVILSDYYSKQFKISGLISDWKNRKEYNLHEYATKDNNY